MLQFLYSMLFSSSRTICFSLLHQSWSHASLPCFPLPYILAASDTIDKQIDLLVLDMSGKDMDILGSVELAELPKLKVCHESLRIL